MRAAILLIVVLASCDSAKKPEGDPTPGRIAARPIDCTTVAAAIRATYTDAQKASFASEPKMARWFETTQRIVRESCELDQWPEVVKKCAVEAKQADPNALAACNQAMPLDLQQKMQDRMVAAMKLLE